MKIKVLLSKNPIEFDVEFIQFDSGVYKLRISPFINEIELVLTAFRHFRADLHIGEYGDRNYVIAFLVTKIYKESCGNYFIEGCDYKAWHYESELKQLIPEPTTHYAKSN